AVARLPLGQGDVRTEFALFVGKLFRPLPLFVDARVGVALRGSATIMDPYFMNQQQIAYASEARFLAEAGYSWFPRHRGAKRVLLLARIEGRYSNGVPSEDGLGILTPVASDFLRTGGEIAWLPTTHFELSVTGGSVVYAHSLPALSELAL